MQSILKHKTDLTYVFYDMCLGGILDENPVKKINNVSMFNILYLYGLFHDLLQDTNYDFGEWVTDYNNIISSMYNLGTISVTNISKDPLWLDDIKKDYDDILNSWISNQDNIKFLFYDLM